MKYTHSLRARYVYPALLFLVGAILSGLAAYFNFQQLDKAAKAEFERLAARTEVEIGSRLGRVVYGLRGLRAHFAANNSEVNQTDFRRFVLSRDLEKEFPGVRGFGFIQRINRPDLQEFVAGARAELGPGFDVRQLVDKTLSDLFVIRYIEPADNNKGAQGLDVGSEAVRRAGIQQAINTGAPTVSGAITLVQDDKKSPGVLLFMPVYREGAPINVPTERRAALVGVLYAPIVMNEVLADLADVQSGMLDFEVIDAPINVPQGPLMFDADGHVSKLEPGQAADTGRRYSLRTPLQLPGRSITLSMNSTPQFDASISFTTPWMIFSGGAMISALLALVLGQQAGGRIRAERMARDMTQDLQIALRDNEALLSTLNLYSIISIADRSGRILEVNDAFCQISGYSREELIGQDHRIVNSAVQSKAFWTDMWKTISSGMPWRGQVCNLAKNGQQYWVDTLIAPFIGTDGKIEKYISIRTEITASKLAQDELRWRQSLLDKMSNSSPLAFLVVDNYTDEILYFNHRFCEIWGIESLAEPMQQRALKNADIIPACMKQIADPEAFAESCKPLQDAKNQVTLEDEIAFTNERTVRRYTTQIRDSEDQYFGRFYIFEDVTERKRSERALAEAIRDAQAAAVSKGQFLANMSHEIRTPMNAILGLLSLLQSTDMTFRQRDYASKAQGAAQSLLGLLNDILDFSKAEAGKMTLESEPFRMDKVLRNLSVVLATNVGNKNVEVLYDVDPTLPTVVLGDAMRLQQVLINLGGNAVKFTAEGQVILSLRKLAETDHTVTIEYAVQDSGIGIAPEHQAHIFSGFSQAEGSTTRRFGGTGLGLAISKRLVELMGGDIQIQSKQGEGSRFSFVLEMPIPAAIPQDLADPERTAQTPLRVLVVEDNPIAGELMLKLVHSWGWEADLATTGAMALDMVNAIAASDSTPWRYPLILMDWQLPDVDGWEATRKIRELAFSKNVTQPTVIMVTGHGREMLAQRSESEQELLNGFLVKPITASMLYDAIVDARAGKSGLREAARGRSSLRQLNGMRILVVEDNLINQQVADELLSAAGALVSLAANGLAGVEAVAAAAPQFDVVLMDVQMPVLDGYGATRVIREQLGLKELPIIAMTANAMASDRDACIAAGMNEHVGKPFDMAKLVSLLIRETGFQALPDGAPETDAAPIPAADLPEIPELDLQGALARMSGMRTLYIRTARDFEKILHTAAGELRQTLASNDNTLAVRQLHTLKGNAATLGAHDLAETAAKLEAQCKTLEGMQTLAQSPDALATLETQIAHAQQLMAQAIAGLEAVPSHATPKAATAATSTVAREPLTKLVALLAASDMEALQHFAETRDKLATLPADALARLDEALQDLDLEAALSVARQILADINGS